MAGYVDDTLQVHDTCDVYDRDVDEWNGESASAAVDDREDCDPPAIDDHYIPTNIIPLKIDGM